MIKISPDQKRQRIMRQMMSVLESHYDLWLATGSLEASGDTDLAAPNRATMAKLELRQKWLEDQLSALDSSIAPEYDPTPSVEEK